MMHINRSKAAKKNYNRHNHLDDSTFIIIDNSHTLSSDDPGFLPEDTLKMIPYGNFEKDNFIDFKVLITEHFGTHIDAPYHFGGPGFLSVDLIPPEHLIGPAAVVDVREKVINNVDYELTVEDLLEWEKRYGEIINGSIIIMFTGWQDRWENPSAYKNEIDGHYHFPGFSFNAVQWLISEREIHGIGVDTLSYDKGSSTDYPVHKILHRANKWGLENMCNLDKLPFSGGFMVVCPMKHEGGSGGPTRIFTFLHKHKEW